MLTEIVAYFNNQKKKLNLVLDIYVKLDDVSSETIGLHHVNGGVMTSHAIRVTSHMRDGPECSVECLNPLPNSLFHPSLKPPFFLVQDSYLWGNLMPCCFFTGVDCGDLGLVLRRFGVLREPLARDFLGFTYVRLIAA